MSRSRVSHVDFCIFFCRPNVLCNGVILLCVCNERASAIPGDHGEADSVTSVYIGVLLQLLLYLWVLYV